MEGSQELAGLITVLTTTKLWHAVIVFIVGFVIANIIRSVASSIFQYIMFKTADFGIGSYVDYKGVKCFIKHMGIRQTTLEIEGKDYTMHIRTANWIDLILIVPHKLKSNYT